MTISVEAVRETGTRAAYSAATSRAALTADGAADTPIAGE